MNEEEHTRLSLHELIEMIEYEDPFFNVFYPAGEEDFKEVLKKSSSFASSLNDFQFNKLGELHNDIMFVLENYIHIGSEDELDYYFNISEDKITLTYSYVEGITEHFHYFEPPEIVEYPMELTVSFKVKTPPQKKIKGLDEINDLMIDSKIDAKVEYRIDTI